MYSNPLQYFMLAITTTTGPGSTAWPWTTRDEIPIRRSKFRRGREPEKGAGGSLCPEPTPFETMQNATRAPFYFKDGLGVTNPYSQKENTCSLKQRRVWVKQLAEE